MQSHNWMPQMSPQAKPKGVVRCAKKCNSYYQTSLPWTWSLVVHIYLQWVYRSGGHSIETPCTWRCTHPRHTPFLKLAPRGEEGVMTGEHRSGVYC